MIGSNDEAPQVLPVGTSRRLEGHTAHPRNLCQDLVQTEQHRKHPLDGRFVLFRMKLLQLVSRDRQLGRFRIVLHSTTTQGIDSQIGRVVLLGESDEVTNNFGLRDLRERGKTVSSQSHRHSTPEITSNLSFNVARPRRDMASLTGLRLFDNERFVPSGLMIHYLDPLRSFVIRPENRSMASPVLISVTQRSELSPSSGKSSTRLLPPCMPARRSLRLIFDVMPRARLKVTTNSW